MEVSTQAVQTLMEVGVMAAGCGFYHQAFQIFEGLEAVRPDSEAPLVGVALIHMNSGEHEEAIKLLREGALVRNPNSINVKMVLGLALRLAGRNAECDNLIKELNASSDPKAKNYAKSLAAR